ncbi:MAG: hypothetical protein FJX30_03465 [Alphaproteobacteria bacterium]|nr:hypothetical protein [Alphaproteobacteria bacterium]
MNKNIFFIGCGKMGTKILNNLIKNNLFSKQDFLILKPSQNNKISDINYISNLSYIPKNYRADVIFICIKPQNSSKILQELAQSKIFNQDTVIISILAGKNTFFFKSIFGQNSQIARCMPNITLEVDHGIIPIFFDNVNENNKILVKNFFKNCGLSFEIKDEKLFHALTALYGCGPAYIFLLQEIFENLAKKYFVPHEIIQELTINLFLGSAVLSQKSSKNFKDLRADVTSKKGVTEASLKSLIKNNKLQNVFSKALENGIRKSQRLEKL